MEIIKNIDGKNVNLVIKGRLDTTTAPELEAEVKELGTDINLVFDFANVEYVSSAGLRVLLLASKLVGGNGSFKIVNVNEAVKEVLDMTGMSSVLNIG